MGDSLLRAVLCKLQKYIAHKFGLEEIVELTQTPHKYLPSCAPSQAMETGTNPVDPSSQCYKRRINMLCNSVLFRM
jgi:hypothetical protein